MDRYLITAIGGDIGSSVARCLCMELGRECLLGCDISEFVQGREYVGDFLLAPPFDDEETYLKFLIDTKLIHGINYIFPSTEQEIKICDIYRKELEETGLHLVINSSWVLKNGFSKYATARLLEQNGILVPDTWFPAERLTPEKYPVILKSDSGCGSKMVKIVYSPEEYEKEILNLDNPVVQEYIGTAKEEYTVGVFSNETQTFSIAFKRKLGPGGMSIYVEYYLDHVISELAIRVSKAFHLKGSLNFQMRKQDGKYYIFEVNPRISSTVGFRYLLNFKDVIWWLDLIKGEKSNISYIPEQASVVGIRTMKEQMFCRGGGTNLNM